MNLKENERMSSTTETATKCSLLACLLSPEKSTIGNFFVSALSEHILSEPLSSRRFPISKIEALYTKLQMKRVLKKY